MPAPLNYSLAELYTNDLLDAFTDYKSIWTVIHQRKKSIIDIRPKILDTKFCDSGGGS
jgi:hypothetical protein